MRRNSPVAKYPDVLIVGAQKAGTTSVFDALSRHREIHAPRFAKDFTSFFSNEQLYSRGDKWYERQFRPSRDQRRVLAANVNYLYSKEVPHRVLKYNPGMLIVICLRRPLARLKSAWVYAVQRGIEKRSLNDSLKAELADIEVSGLDVNDRQRDYIRHSLYSSGVGRYVSAFSREQVHVLFFEELLKNPAEQLVHLQKFLGLKIDELVEFPHSNKTGGYPRSLWLAGLLSGESRVRKTWRRYGIPMPMSWKYTIIKKIERFNTNPEKKIQVELVEDGRIGDYLKNDIGRLENILGRAVPESWHNI